MGNSGDDDSVFKGSTGDNLIKVDGDLDIDFDALPSDNSDGEASDEEGDTLPILSTESRTQSTRHSRSRLYWRFGPVHNLPVDSKPAHNFGLGFFFFLQQNIQTNGRYWNYKL